MKIILVLGKTVLPTGELSSDLKLQVERATELLQADEDSSLVLTGGITRPGFCPEAEVALTLVPHELRSRVLLETVSLSTRQSVRSVKNMLCDTKIDSIVAISTSGHEKRTRFLFKKVWPEMVSRLSFESVRKNGFVERIAHTLIYWLTILDPDEKLFLPLKKCIIR